MRRYHRKTRALFVAGLVSTLFCRVDLSAQPPSEITVMSESGPRSIPISRFAGVDMVPLELLSRLVGASLRPADDRTAINLTVDGKMARVSDGRVFVPVEGRLVALSSPARLMSGNWFVPLDFLSKVLPSVSDTSVIYRARARMLLIGEEFPTLQIHARTSPSFTRIDIDTSGPVPVEVTQGGDEIRVTIQAPYVQTRFENEEILDEVVKRISLERGDTSYMLTIELGERFGTLKALEKSGRDHGLVLDLLRSRVPTAAEARDGEPKEIHEDLRSIEERAAAAESEALAAQEPMLGEDGEEMTDFDTIELTPDYEVGVARSPGLPLPTSDGPTRLSIVTIDPGHGGAESGAEGSGGLIEKDLVLSIARELRQLLQARLGLRVILTHDGDRTLSLDERTAIANNNKADLFVSIHADASPRRNARGSSVYFLSYSSSDADSQRVTMAQNRGSGGGDLDFILWDMAQASHLSQSSRFSEILQEELLSATGSGRSNRGIKQNTFRVLKGATMPAVLVEVGFISNADEEKLLTTKDYQNKLAEALFRGVLRFKDLYESESSSETASRGQR
jgi:N-acetylmuramoyl-L-alanine amidase